MSKSLGIWVGLLGLLPVACSSSRDATEAAPGTTHQAIWHGRAETVDSATGYTNAIVYLASNSNGAFCTGYYVTSTLILSAAHCFRGLGPDYGNTSLTIKEGDTVHIGPDTTAWDANVDRKIVSVETMATGAVGVADVRHDVALIEALPPVVREAFPQKPRFVVPPLSGGRGTFPILIGGFGKTETGANPTLRQLQSFNLAFDPSQNVARGSDFGFEPVWGMSFDPDNGPYLGPDHGDSGSPLIWRSGNQFDVIGVYSGGNAQDQSFPLPFFGDHFPHSWWVDITSGDVKAWLQSAATNHAPSPENVRWRGETDYTGPCILSEDSDCDGFINPDKGGTDNCPTRYNPEQLAGPDTDGDGVADYCDNCPADPNPIQTNSDRDDYGDACDTCNDKFDEAACDTGCPGPNCKPGCPGIGNSCKHFTDPTLAGCFDPSINNINCDVVSFCMRPRDTDLDNVADSCDNCLSKQNTNQANCNIDAELATGRDVLGDACDLFPCSASTALDTPFDRGFSGSTCSTAGGLTCPISLSADIGWQGESAAANTSPDTGTTVFAHCVCANRMHTSPRDRIANCQTDATGHALCRAGIAAMFPFPSSSQASGWRAISTQAPRPMSIPDPNAVRVRVPIGSLIGTATTIAGATAGVINALHPTVYQQSGAPKGRTRWLFDQDATRFGVSYSPPSGGYSDATQLQIAVAPLDGVGWAFTSSLNGASTIDVTADMASNYFPQDLDPQGDFELPGITLPIAALPPWIRISPETGCFGCSSKRFPWLTHLDDPRINPGDFIGIGTDVVQVIRPNFDAGLLDKFSRLGSGLKLFTASETAEAVERLLATDRGAFVDVVTGQITAVRGTTEGGLASQLLPVSLTAAPDAAAFSAAHAELYGFSNRNGIETLTTVNTRVAKLTELPLLGLTAGTPLSATYRLADDAVYVLDRLGSSSSSPVRISRVDRSGNARDLGQIADLGLRTNLSLATTFDDQLLLTASGQAWDQVLYLVLRVNDASVDVVSSRFEPQPGSMLLPPVANRAGGFAVATRSGLGAARFGEAKPADFVALSSTALANASNLLKARSSLDSCPIQTVTGSSNCSPLRSLAVYASRRLKIDDRAQVRTAGSTLALIGSGGSSQTSIGTDTQLGNVQSLGSVNLRDRARLNGFLTTAGTLTRGNSVVISGTTTQHASVLPIPLAGFGADFPTTNSGNVMLEPDTTRTLTAGAYGDVSVKSRSTLRLSTGVYALRSLFLEPQATLSIDTSAGPVFIYVQTSFTFRGAVVTRGGSSADLLVAVFGSQAVAVEAPFTGTIVAPSAAINLASVNSPHVGSFFGLDVEVFPEVAVVFQPFNYPWSP